MLTFYPRDTHVVAGGIRMVSFNLIEGLKKYADLDLHVVHCHSDIDRDQVVHDGNVTVYYFAMPRRRIVPNLVRSIGRIVQVVRELDPDLIHAHAGHFAYAAAKSGYPTVFTLHGVLRHERRVYTRTLFDRLRYGLLAYYERRALRRVQRLVAISPYVQKEYAQASPVPWVRIDNPVPRGYFDLAGPCEPDRVLYAGSITEIKDILTLLRAIEQVRRVHPAVTLRIAGRTTSSDYARRVRAYVAEHDLQGAVQFLGLLDRQAIMAEYARCAVVALSSVQENAPMTLIEAMAAAKPVVATRVGGVPGLVDEGETGFMVPAGDDAAMAQRLGQLLQDSALRERMGRRARVVARERFGVDRIARLYYDLYQEVLAEAG